MSGDSTKPMTLPSGPATLCFDKDDFMKSDFNVDTFVMDCRRRVPLETLRDDLHVYLKILRSAMIELINKDYADFVNLSTNLVGMDKAINNLTVPLGQFKEEVLSVTSAMENAIEAVEEKLKHRQKIKEKKASLQRLINIVQSVEKIEQLLGLSSKLEATPGTALNGQLIERVATEFNKLQFYVMKSRGLPLVEQVKPRITNITSTLQYSLEGSFLEGLDHNNTDILRQCLRTYALIDKIKDAESLFRKHVVRPFMEEIITEDFLRSSNLKGMYSKILEFVPKHCQILKDITSSSSPSGDVIRGYDFVVNAVWPEIISNIEARIPSIFAPGNPDVFHEKFTISTDFVSKFERQCGSQASVKRLREHSSYLLFMSKWNLPVYFQIRFQEIAGLFENSLVIGFNNTTESEEFYLTASHQLWDSIYKCWQSNVYIPTLLHRFLKLTLQLLSRYSAWIDDTYQKEVDKPSITSGSRTDRASTPANSSITSKVNGLDTGNQQQQQQPTPPEPEPITLGQILFLMADVEKTSEKIFPVFVEHIEPKLKSLDLENIDLIRGAFSDSQASVLFNMPKFQSYIVQEVTNPCSLHLKQVADIPRHYRRTNREVPSKPSSYSTGLFKPLVMFFEEHKTVLSKTKKEEIAREVLENLAEQYYTATSDVLTSVKKMEDSLKRLKKARGTGVSTGTQGMSDDDKIRQQLIVDIEYYGQQVETFGFSSNSLRGFSQLLELCKEAKGSMSQAATNPSS